MPNGGPTPDCFHCKWFALDDKRCTKHNFQIKLSVIRMFCADLAIEDDPKWVTEMVDVDTLVPQMLYIWLEIDYKDLQGKHHHEFNLYPYASIADYISWSEDQESDVLFKLHEAQRLLYEQRGYNVE